MTIERIGVIGAGQMGNGIAHVLALAGFDVVLDDINKDTLAKAVERIDKNMHRQAARGMIKSEAIEPALKRSEPSGLVCLASSSGRSEYSITWRTPSATRSERPAPRQQAQGYGSRPQGGSRGRRSGGGRRSYGR